MFKFLKLTAKCICVGALLLLPVAAGTKTAFTPGETYTFYRGSCSSQAEIITCNSAIAPIYKYLFSDSITGESTVYTAEEVDASYIIEKYAAEVLFTETVGETVNYYCYSSALEGKVVIGEYSVNLHIAKNVKQTAVGTPVIFGGF